MQAHGRDQHVVQRISPQEQGSSSPAGAHELADLGIGPDVFETGTDGTATGVSPSAAASGQPSRHARAQEDLQASWEAKRPALFPLLVERSAVADEQCMRCMAKPAVVKCSGCALVSDNIQQVLCFGPV